MRRIYFEQQHRIEIDAEKCVGCQMCMAHCPVGRVLAFDEDAKKVSAIQIAYCIGCLACVDRCPAGAVKTIAI